MSEPTLDAELWERLQRQRSWHLHRVSNTTSACDIACVDRRFNQVTMPEEQINKLIKAGFCYRCRLGKKAWWYGRTPNEAVRAALNGQYP